MSVSDWMVSVWDWRMFGCGWVVSVWNCWMCVEWSMILFHAFYHAPHQRADEISCVDYIVAIDVVVISHWIYLSAEDRVIEEPRYPQITPLEVIQSIHSMPLFMPFDTLCSNRSIHSHAHSSPSSTSLCLGVLTSCSLRWKRLVSHV